MEEGIVDELDERLERDDEAAAIVEDRVVMVRDAPRPRIEIEARVKLAALRRAAELSIDVAAAQRPVSPARAHIVFEDLHFIACPAELERRRHAGEACAKHDDGGALRIAFELDRAPVRRFRRESKTRH